MNEGVEAAAVGGRGGGGNYSSYEIVIKTLWGWKAAPKAFGWRATAPAPRLLISIGKHFFSVQKIFFQLSTQVSVLGHLSQNSQRLEEIRRNFPSQNKLSRRQTQRFPPSVVMQSGLFWTKARLL